MIGNVGVVRVIWQRRSAEMRKLRQLRRRSVLALVHLARWMRMTVVVVDVDVVHVV